jgi:lambda repressor-like predicted transcriptional regulator
MLAQFATTARASTVNRDRLIRELRTSGVTLRQLAAAAGLSHTAVAKIAAKSPTTPSRKATP